MPQTPENMTDLINTIYRHANFWEASAQIAAMNAVRTGKKADMDDARRVMARHEACIDLAKKITPILHAFFRSQNPPKD